MQHIFTILHAMLETKFLSVERLALWTDPLIEKLDFPRFWLIELSMAPTPQDAIGIINEAHHDLWLPALDMDDDEYRDRLEIGFTLLG